MGTKTKKEAFVERASCVACGCCVKVCPFQLIQIRYGSYAQIDRERCVGCGKCAIECPATVITMIDRGQHNEETMV